MTKLGFLLDSDGCIGCHACTVACKSEHDVPLGVNRTWLKYVETGEFPSTARHFTVMRCNHCDDAPCMTICPTSALHRTDNGVVDFDTALCIGCKGCMNACPYDAIYINPETNVANKCNFCNHRVEVGLEPACVVVCPTHSIKVIDFDDVDNEARKIIGREDVAVRSPEQNTNPKVYYRGANQAALDPLRSRIPADGLIWADTTPNHPTPPHIDAGVIARTTYTTGSHPLTWKGKVSGYLVTKAIAAGVMLVAALMVLMGHSGEQAAVGVVPPMIGGAFLAVTGVLLIADLKRPERFYFLITKGNSSSWLVKGAYILGAYAAVM
ncbi:MAG: 4Fe-4S binding protein, partial [Acidimicrobiales bacterium]|nr:4Fe-4S binding protein [Acidimicrobiales bacterium]